MAHRDWLGISELKTLWRRLCAEFFGVMFIVFLGCGSTIGGWILDESPPTLIRVSFAFGFSVATVVECIGHVSGGHVNPAITAAMLLLGRIRVLPALLYVAAQLLGAMAGSALLFELTPYSQQEAIGQNMINPKLTAAQGMGVEWLITALLVFVVLSLTDPHRGEHGKGSISLAVGVAVTVGHLYSIRATGCGMNPARVFGPAVVTGTWDNHWAYWVGEIGGALTAAIIYVAVFSAEKGGNPFSRLKAAILGTDSNNVALEASKETVAVSMETLSHNKMHETS